MKAARDGFFKIVQVLLLKNANTDVQTSDSGLTALMYAAKKGYTKIVDSLIEKGANLNLQDSMGYTALHWADDMGHVPIATALIAGGCDIEKKDMSGNNGASIDFALSSVASYLVDIHITKLFVSFTFLVLHKASEKGHHVIVRSLIKKQVDLEAKGLDGETAMQKAVMKGQEIVIKALLEAGAKARDKTGTLTRFRS